MRQEASSRNRKSRRARRIERTASAPSTSVRRESVTTMPLSQPQTHVICNPTIDTDKLVIDVDAANVKEPLRGSRHEPINIDSSPIKIRPKETNEVTNSFFAPRKRSVNTGANRTRREPEQSAPWPGGGDQHVRGLQSTFLPTHLDFARAFFDPTREELELSLKFLEAQPERVVSRQCPSGYPIPQQATSLAEHQPFLTIAKDHNLPSSLTRFTSPITDAPRSCQEAWNERWHPRLAAEVIGNEERAHYLRDWLSALEVQTVRQPATRDSTVIPDIFSIEHSQPSRLKKGVYNTKRPAVIRMVDKSRRKRRRTDSDDSEIEDWIADDDETENPWRQATPFFDDHEELPDHIEEGGSPWKPRMTRLKRRRAEESESANPELGSPVVQPQEDPKYDFTAYLTNTILLCGPTGCGKTAAVYACAEELGWEVFEVYPGIGKRNGASLLSLVGDAGKHHLVGKGSTRTAPSQDTQKRGMIASFFSGKDSSTSPEIDLALNAENNNPPSNAPLIALEQHLSSEVLSSISNRENEPTQMLNRQSIILLEEVDILFGEDVHFWPTVVTLIKESKRPVVMTCNGALVILMIIPYPVKKELLPFRS